MEQDRPQIGITMGDPAGIGPEIIAAAWTNPELHAWCRPVVVGHPAVLERAVQLRASPAKVVEIQTVAQAQPSPRVMPCLASSRGDLSGLEPGRIDPRAGHAAYEAVVCATQLALQGPFDAITTAPLHKEALDRAGHHYPGHTELLAELCGSGTFAMMLYLGPGEPLRGSAGLAVVHVTLHTAMRRVFETLTPEAVLAKARLAQQFMASLKSELPRIGVCALNPHAGEGGLFGDEEESIIRPAVEQGRAEGMLIDGPLPADTLMVHARDGRFDAVVAMYHDQGHITLKLLGMHRAVNVTLGLPIIRTSVAHGTAFDIAWQGRADCRSLLEAVRVASRLAALRKA